MKIRALVRGLTSALLAGLSIVGLSEISSGETRQAQSYIFCGSYNGEPATIAQHPNPTVGDVVLIVWQTTIFGSRFTPQHRCEVVSERFQRTNSNGTLGYVVPGIRNEYTVLCASDSPPTDELSDCPEDRLLLTLRHSDDPNEIIQHLRNINSDRTDEPIYHTGELVSSPSNQYLGLDVELWIFHAPSRFP